MAWTAAPASKRMCSRDEVGIENRAMDRANLYLLVVTYFLEETQKVVTVCFLFYFLSSTRISAVVPLGLPPPRLFAKEESHAAESVRLTFTFQALLHVRDMVFQIRRRKRIVVEILLQAS